MTTITIKNHNIAAVFKKQIKDNLKNKMVFIQFILYPLFAFVFTEAVAKGQQDLLNTFFVTIFGTIYAGMVPMINMASIISEEKEADTLKMLMIANVKPYQYLIAIGSSVMIFFSLGAASFGIIGGYSGIVLLKFIIAMLCGGLSSLLLGSAIGMLSKNQMSATAIGMPIAMIISFLPMIATFNVKFESISRFLYTQQISYILNDPNAAKISLESILIIGSNLLVFLSVFVVAYRKNSKIN